MILPNPDDPFRSVMYADIRDWLAHWAKNHPPSARIAEVSGRFLEWHFGTPGLVENFDYPDFDVTDTMEVAPQSGRYFRYDLVMLDQVLEHVDQPGDALENVYQMLKEGGWVILTTPFGFPLHDVETGDYWRFTGQGLRKLLDVCNFNDVTIKSWGNYKATVAALDWQEWRREHIGTVPNGWEKNDPKFPVVYWAYGRKV